MTLAACPFDKTHRVEVLEMAVHIETCRMNHPGVRRVQCQDHEVSIENYPTHLIVCSSSGGRDGSTQSKKKPKKNPKTNGDVANGTSSVKTIPPKKKQPIADHFYPPVVLSDSSSSKGKQKNKNSVAKQTKDAVNKPKNAKAPKGKNKKPQKKEDSVGSPPKSTWFEEIEGTLSSVPCVKLRPIPESLIFEPNFLKKSNDDRPVQAEESCSGVVGKSAEIVGYSEQDYANKKECVSVQKGPILAEESITCNGEKPVDIITDSEQNNLNENESVPVHKNTVPLGEVSFFNEEKSVGIISCSEQNNFNEKEYGPVENAPISEKEEESSRIEKKPVYIAAYAEDVNVHVKECVSMQISSFPIETTSSSIKETPVEIENCNEENNKDCVTVRNDSQDECFDVCSGGGDQEMDVNELPVENSNAKCLGLRNVEVFSEKLVSENLPLPYTVSENRPIEQLSSELKSQMHFEMDGRDKATEERGGNGSFSGDVDRNLLETKLHCESEFQLIEDNHSSEDLDSNQPHSQVAMKLGGQSSISSSNCESNADKNAPIELEKSQLDINIDSPVYQTHHASEVLSSALENKYCVNERQNCESDSDENGPIDCRLSENHELVFSICCPVYQTQHSSVELSSVLDSKSCVNVEMHSTPGTSGPSEELQTSKQKTTSSSVGLESVSSEFKIKVEETPYVSAEKIQLSRGVLIQEDKGSPPSSIAVDGKSVNVSSEETLQKAEATEETSQPNETHPERDAGSSNSFSTEPRVEKLDPKNRFSVYEFDNSEIATNSREDTPTILPQVNLTHQFLPEARNTPVGEYDCSKKSEIRFSIEKKPAIVKNASTPLGELNTSEKSVGQYKRDASQFEEAHRSVVIKSAKSRAREHDPGVSEPDAQEEGMDTMCSDDVFETEAVPLENCYSKAGAIPNTQMVVQPQVCGDFTAQVPVLGLHQFDATESCVQVPEFASGEVFLENKASFPESVVAYENSNAGWNLQPQGDGVTSEEREALPEGAVIDFNEVIYIPYGEIEMPVMPEHTTPCEIRLKRMPGPVHRAYQSIRKEVTDLNAVIRKISSPEIAEYICLKIKLKKAEDKYEEYLNDFLNFRA